jgi:hypothetical protein
MIDVLNGWRSLQRVVRQYQTWIGNVRVYVAPFATRDSDGANEDIAEVKK